MAIKAVFVITAVNAGLDSTFTVDGRYAFMDATSQNSGDIAGIGPFTPGILSATLESGIKDAVKDYLGITGLDTVRLIGATL